nr:histone-lysine N-methyltransferase SETMAR-like [Lepeophtheirus salmonis]
MEDASGTGQASREGDGTKSSQPAEKERPAELEMQAEVDIQAEQESTVKNWFNEFNRGRSSLKDKFRKGRPKTAVVPENIDPVREVIMQDHHVTYREIEASLGISSTSIHLTLHVHLAVKKLCSRWIPHNLAIAQKTAGVD